tara:strand:- start:11 stop:310 length:300 start_codon:yes stop_codon:yes gene_type:complete
MDFLTEILISFAVAVVIYFGLIQAKISKDNAQLIAALLGGWVFAQIPKYSRYTNTEYEIKQVNYYSTMRSYFVGLIIASYLAGKYLGIDAPAFNTVRRF